MWILARLSSMGVLAATAWLTFVLWVDYLPIGTGKNQGIAPLRVYLASVGIWLSGLIAFGLLHSFTEGWYGVGSILVFYSACLGTAGIWRFIRDRSPRLGEMLAKPATPLERFVVFGGVVICFALLAALNVAALRALGLSHFEIFGPDV